MAAGKLNYVVVYKNVSQVYGCASKKIALESPPPEGCTLSDKKVLFITFEPDGETLSVYQVPDEEVQNAEIKKKKQEQEND
jgi:hypothetical protein